MTHRSMQLSLVAMGVLCCMLVSCTTSIPLSPSPKPSQATSPLDPTLRESPLPTPEPSAEALLERNPTPEPETGNVQGILTMNRKPAQGRTLYLAKLIHSASGDTGIGGVAALDPVNDPRAESDMSGYFVFLNVPPGKYALGTNSPIGPVLINRDGEEIYAEVEAGEVTDIGKIVIVPFDQ